MAPKSILKVTSGSNANPNPEAVHEEAEDRTSEDLKQAYDNISRDIEHGQQEHGLGLEEQGHSVTTSPEPLGGSIERGPRQGQERGGGRGSASDRRRDRGSPAGRRSPGGSPSQSPKPKVRYSDSPVPPFVVGTGAYLSIARCGILFGVYSLSV